MTVMQTVQDFFSGNFTHAWARIADWLISSLGLPKWLVAMITQALNPQFKILQDAIENSVTGLKALPANPTTEDFVGAAKDVLAKLVAEEVEAFSLPYIFSVLNAAFDNYAAV